jgi:hypothetical protein
VNTKSTVARGAALYSQNASRVLAVAAPTWLPVYAAQALIAIALGLPSRMAAVIGDVRTGGSPDVTDVYALAGYAVFSIVVMLAALALSQGALIAAFAAAEKDAAVVFRKAWRRGWRRAPALLATVLLVAAVVVIGEAVLYGLGIGIARVDGVGAFAVTAMLALGTILPLLLAAPFAVAPQLTVLDGCGPVASLRVSAVMLGPRYWRVLGILVVLSAVGWVATAVLSLPARAAGDGTAFVAISAAMSAVGAVVVQPFVVAVLTALYFSAGGSATAIDADVHPDTDGARKRLGIGLTALLLIAAGGDNNAIAINTKDDSTDVKVAFKIVRANGDIVAPTNFAFAYASCSSCETAAIAIEVVFVTSTDASVVSPVNEAWAVNYACTDCQTLADAYQFTLTTGQPVHLTADGNKQIAEIRRQLQAIAHSDMSLTDTATAVQNLTAQLEHVLTTDVVPAGPPPSPPPAAPATESPAASPVASPSPSAATPEPTPSESPNPSPSPSASPSPSPS